MLIFTPNQWLLSGHPIPQEGRWPSSRTRGGMRWTRQRLACDGVAGRVGERPVSDQQHADERCSSRTAKSCGPDTPTLVSRLRMLCRPYRARMQRQSANDGGKRARSPGRARRKPLKPLRAGTSGDSGVLVVTRVRSTTTKCTRGRGCNGHPAFPTPSIGREISCKASGASRREPSIHICLVFHVCLVFDVSFAFDIESGSAQRWRLGAPELKPS